METEFTPWVSLGGGLLIGLAATLLMVMHGRIFGATGILGGLLRFNDPGDWAVRAALIVGMAGGPLVFRLATGAMPVTDLPISNLAVAIGGLIVGVGVSFGGGCTSGHGVCGLARGSWRSMVATATFMAAAILTVTIIRHVVGA